MVYYSVSLLRKSYRESSLCKITHFRGGHDVGVETYELNSIMNHLVQSEVYVVNNTSTYLILQSINRLFLITAFCLHVTHYQQGSCKLLKSVES